MPRPGTPTVTTNIEPPPTRPGLDVRPVFDGLPKTAARFVPQRQGGRCCGPVCAGFMATLADWPHTVDTSQYCGPMTAPQLALMFDKLKDDGTCTAVHRLPPGNTTRLDDIIKTNKLCAVSVSHPRYGGHWMVVTGTVEGAKAKDLLVFDPIDACIYRVPKHVLCATFSKDCDEMIVCP